MTPGRTSSWCSVRCLFSWQCTTGRVYEERITLWRTADLDEAIARAEAEARTYAHESTQALGQAVDYIGLAQAYLLADAPGEGGEVFSLMRTHPAPPKAYLDTFFTTGSERTQ